MVIRHRCAESACETLHKIDTSERIERKHLNSGKCSANASQPIYVAECVCVKGWTPVFSDVSMLAKPLQISCQHLQM